MFYPDKNKNGEIVLLQPPFKSKYTKDGKLYRKKHGVLYDLPATTGVIELVNPYAKAKINKIDLLWFPEGVTADFIILDSADGIYQRLVLGLPTEAVTPNLPLSQHGFAAGIAKDLCSDVSEYDATILGGMVMRLSLTNNLGIAKKVCANFYLHEVVVE